MASNDPKPGVQKNENAANSAKAAEQKPTIQKEQPRPQSPKDNSRWGFIAVVVVVFLAVFYLLFLSITKAPPNVDVATPTPKPSAIIPTATPIAATAIPSEEPTLTPIGTFVPKVYSQCGTVSKGITLNSDLETTADCLIVMAPDVTIDCAGFKISGKNYLNSTGIYSNYSNTVIKNCVIQSIGLGIRLKRADGSTIQNTNIVGAIGGILIEDGSKITIRENTVSNTTKFGIAVYGISDSIIERNLANYGKWTGIQLTSTKGITVRENQVYSNNIGLQITASGSSTISANNVSFNFAGIKMTSRSTGNLLYANSITNNKQFGLHVLDSFGNTLRQNTMTGNEYGANLYDSVNNLDRNFICDNTIEDIECYKAQNATGDTCYLRATTCGFDCAYKCPSSK